MATLRRGDSGAEVLALQVALHAAGVATAPALAPDGVFGPATDAAVRAFQASRGLEVDGLAGPDTMAALEGLDDAAACSSSPELPAVLSARVARARSAIGKGIRYKLGRGGFAPNNALPGRAGDPALDDHAGCDCSGFAAWIAGLSRGPRQVAPAWIETSAIVADATGARRTFRQVAAPIPGAFVVYPDHAGDQGHIGLLTSTAGGVLRGVDCSSSRSKATGQAITERGLEFFRKAGAIYVLLVTDPDVSSMGNC